MSEYPQELIETLRNIIDAQKKKIAEQDAIIHADWLMMCYYKEQAKQAKGE